MAVKKITIEQFLEGSNTSPVFDVRSPGEYSHAHIPGAYGLPLFTDEERKVVGTAYKKEGRQIAIKIGLDYFGGKMRSMVEEVEKIIATHPIQNGQTGDRRVFVHCWRGGMRSAGVAWLLDLYGYDVYTLVGGYKVFRRWVLSQFEKDYELKILGGYTGSAKTEVLKKLQLSGQTVIDLEGLASHKGSAFGALGQPAQPSQEMFENKLAIKLHEAFSGEKGKREGCWLEDESQRIGIVNIPHSFWKVMRTKPVFFLEIPFEERLNYIVQHYGSFDKELLTNSILRIQKRLGGLDTKNAIGFIRENNVKECFSILLAYYDKAYLAGLQNREKPGLLLNKVECPSVNIELLTEKLISCVPVSS